MDEISLPDLKLNFYYWMFLEVVMPDNSSKMKPKLAAWVIVSLVVYGCVTAKYTKIYKYILLLHKHSKQKLRFKKKPLFFFR